MSGDDVVLLEVDDSVAWLTLNRPDAANARNQPMRDRLTQVLSWLEVTDDVRAVVLTGAGERFFSAGMDLKEAARSESSSARRDRLRGSRDVERLAALPQPTVAAINGHAIGGGLEMALACDFRVVSEHAELWLPEVGVGLMPGAGATQRLPAIVGYANATALVLLGERVGASDAVRLGLASAAVASTELRATASALAEKLAALPAAAARRAKEALRSSLEVALSTGVQLELEGLLLLLQDRESATTTEATEAP